MSTSTTPTFITEMLRCTCYFATAALNDCYSEATAYTALAYSYWASFHDAYICLRHAHYRYRLQLPYKSHRTYLTNRTGSISHHIMPLVINSLGADTQTHTRLQTFADRSNSKKPACGRRAPGLKSRLTKDESKRHENNKGSCGRK